MYVVCVFSGSSLEEPSGNDTPINVHIQSSDLDFEVAYHIKESKEPMKK
jgi:hypothetical protein